MNPRAHPQQHNSNNNAAAMMDDSDAGVDMSQVHISSPVHQHEQHGGEQAYEEDTDGEALQQQLQQQYQLQQQQLQQQQQQYAQATSSHPHQPHPPQQHASPSPRYYKEYTSLPSPTLFHFLLNTQLNIHLSRFLPTRDLFFIQFLNRSIFTLCNSNAELLQQYYTEVRLDSFIPFMVDDTFVQAFLTPSFLDLPDGSRAVRNTYSMHIKKFYLNFCTRISNYSLRCISAHIGSNLLVLDLEGGGRSRINENGICELFQYCQNIQHLNLNGFYQINMITTLQSLVTYCPSITYLAMNGCSQMNDTAISVLCHGGLQLRELFLNCSNVNDINIAYIAQAYAATLTVLHIGYCGSITDSGLFVLTQHCRELRDLNLYACYGLSQHALSYLRLCTKLEHVDISRIHAVNDNSIAQWILSTAQLQHQQLIIMQLVQQQNITNAGAGVVALNASSHPDYNPNLSSLFHLQTSFHSTTLDPYNPIYQQHASHHLKWVSLDTCSRITALGMKILIENTPRLEYLNIFGNLNMSFADLSNLLYLVYTKQLPLSELEIGGCSNMSVYSREVEMLRKEFKQIKF